MTRGRGCRGQAAIELLAALPIVLLAGFVAWQLVAVLAAGLHAQEELRRAGLRPGAPAVLTATAAVPALLPGMDGLRVRARAGVRAP